jgi:hypothetical protein
VSEDEGGVMDIDEVDDSRTSGIFRRRSGGLGSKAAAVSVVAAVAVAVLAVAVYQYSGKYEIPAAAKKCKSEQRSSPTASAQGIQPRIWTVAAYGTEGRPVEEVALLRTGSPLIAKEDSHKYMFQHSTEINY